MDTNPVFHRTIPATHGVPARAGANGGIGSLAARVAEGLVRGLVTCVFAAVGTVLGAVAGGLNGLTTETGVVRGTGVGGITGALVSMEVVESSLAMWRSDKPAIWSVVYVVDTMSAVESPVGHGEGADIFDTGGTVPRAAIDLLPVVKLAELGNVVDAGGDQVGCSVCLQDFEAGESARSMPVCRHTFHLPCIDGWLLRHASCPLCRRAV